MLSTGKGEVVMREVSVVRLYMLRATYLLIVVGLGIKIWPSLIHHRPEWPLMSSVVSAMLGAMALLALLGLRYPLQMLPLLLFELVWKSIWLLTVATPLWLAHRIDVNTAETVAACLMGVIFPIVIPWRYVFANYMAKRGDRWRYDEACSGTSVCATVQASE